MKKHILLFMLMSSVLTSTALAIADRNGPCLQKIMASSGHQTLNPDGSNVVRQQVTSSTSASAVNSRK